LLALLLLWKVVLLGCPVQPQTSPEPAVHLAVHLLLLLLLLLQVAAPMYLLAQCCQPLLLLLLLLHIG
jgi:hypothetical protein